MNKLIAALLEAPDSHLDSSMKPYIEKWHNPPRALEVLEVLDYCTFSALASTFMMQVLNILLEEAFKNENTTLTEITPHAVWRKKFD